MTSPFVARYESDFCEWSMQQAALVRTLAKSRLNVDIDRRDSKTTRRADGLEWRGGLPDAPYGTTIEAN